MFDGNGFYYAMLLSGAVAGVTAYFLNAKIFKRGGFKKGYPALAVFCCALPAALVLSFVTAYLIRDDLRGLSLPELLPILGKEYFFTLVYFSALSAAAFWVFGLPFAALDKAAPSLAAFSAIARIGCLWAGCCGGINGVPTAELELAFGVTAFVLLQFFCKKGALLKYVAAYSAFRLIAEFFRAEPAPYHAVQICAAAALAVAGAAFLYAGRAAGKKELRIEKLRTK
ncbi:MAG: prolipoprotein diacylglyceryl transferase [Clostridiales bacterium]|jgi:hypothetical protein|nr:prolipoprotein diacylglyceryl transferase [Clostridiales bacterium]